MKNMKDKRKTRKKDKKEGKKKDLNSEKKRKGSSNEKRTNKKKKWYPKKDKIQSSTNKKTKATNSRKSQRSHIRPNTPLTSPNGHYPTPCKKQSPTPNPPNPPARARLPSTPPLLASSTAPSASISSRNPAIATKSRKSEEMTLSDTESMILRRILLPITRDRDQMLQRTVSPSKLPSETAFSSLRTPPKTNDPQHPFHIPLLIPSVCPTLASKLLIII